MVGSFYLKRNMSKILKDLMGFTYHTYKIRMYKWNEMKNQIEFFGLKTEV